MSDALSHTHKYSMDEALNEMESSLRAQYSVSKRFIACLLLEDDEEIKELVGSRDRAALQCAEEVKKKLHVSSKEPMEYRLAIRHKKTAQEIASKVMRFDREKAVLHRWLDILLMHPVSGLIFLGLVLYWGLFQFVGVLGAGIVVDFIEDTIFLKYLNPFFTVIFVKILPWPVLQDLFIGEYGVVTLGLRYAVALILPIVTFFFIIFSIIEDSGYLPRLAMLL